MITKIALLEKPTQKITFMYSSHCEQELSQNRVHTSSIKKVKLLKIPEKSS